MPVHASSRRSYSKKVTTLLLLSYIENVFEARSEREDGFTSSVTAGSLGEAFSSVGDNEEEEDEEQK